MPIISNFPGGSGSGGGLALATATSIKTLIAHEKVYIQWTDPEDLVVAGSTLASWSGTLLVRKAGSMPTSRRDGVIVLDSKVRNNYKDAYFCDSGLTDGTTYYYKLFPYTTANTYTDVENDGFSATPNAVPVGDVSGIVLAPAGNGKMSIKWTDPDAMVVNDGVTVSIWEKTVVVVTADSAATSPNDPNALFTYTSMTRNGHTETPVIANGLTNGKLYYVALFSIAVDGAVNTNEANQAVGIADKMQGSFTLSDTEVVLNASTLSNSVTVTRLGDGVVTAESNDTDIATVEVSDNVITVRHVNLTTGVATVTVHVAEGEDYKAAEDQTFTVIAQFMPTKKVLNDQTWAEIGQVSDAGKGSEYWSVGDRKGVLVNGTIGTLAVNQTLYVYILGFDHNSSKEGNGIQFGAFKTALSGGTDVCLVDGSYNSYKTDGTKLFNMNHWGNYNYGGWKACDLRYDILGSTNQAPVNYGNARTTSDVGYDAPTNTATSPVANTLMAALPADLRAVMKPITKYTDNKGNSSDVAANVTSSLDYLPLLAEQEVFGGNRTYSNQYEKNYQAQYAYYSAGNSKVKYRHSATGSTAHWWERSPSYNVSGAFCSVLAGGNAGSYGARLSYGLAPAFMV